MSNTSSKDPLNFDGIYPRQIAGKVYKLGTIKDFYSDFNLIDDSDFLLLHGKQTKINLKS